MKLAGDVRHERALAASAAGREHELGEQQVRHQLALTATSALLVADRRPPRAEVMPIAAATTYRPPHFVGALGPSIWSSARVGSCHQRPRGGD